MPKLSIPHCRKCCYNCLGWLACRNLPVISATLLTDCFDMFCAECGEEMDETGRHESLHNRLWHLENCFKDGDWHQYKLPPEERYEKKAKEFKLKMDRLAEDFKKQFPGGTVEILKS